MYYLISNYTKISEFSYDTKDILIHFNYPKHIDRFKDHKRNILVGRSPIFWKKINLYPEYSIFFHRIYVSQKPKNIIDQYPYIKFNIEELEQTFIYPNDYIPTTGFTVFNLLRRYNRDITLVGFTGNGWHGHNFYYEQQIYKILEVKMI